MRYCEIFQVYTAILYIKRVSFITSMQNENTFTVTLPARSENVTILWSDWEIMGGDGTVNSQWTNVMAQAIEKANPYCSFAFKYHW